jgi:hypothetical protein
MAWVGLLAVLMGIHILSMEERNVGGYAAGVYRYPQDRLSIIALTNNVKLSGAQVTNAIADFYQPGVSVFSVKATSPEPDPKIKRSLLTILQGKPEGISFTPDFLLRQKTGRGRYTAVLPSFW